MTSPFRGESAERGCRFNLASARVTIYGLTIVVHGTAGNKSLLSSDLQDMARRVEFDR